MNILPLDFCAEQKSAILPTPLTNIGVYIKTSVIFLVFVLFASLFSACGKSKEESSNVIYVPPATNNYKSGACGSQVISDARQMQINCIFLFTSNAVDQCKSGIAGFRAKYPGINCKALETSADKSSQKEITINNDWINDYIDEVNQRLK